MKALTRFAYAKLVRDPYISQNRPTTSKQKKLALKASHRVRVKMSNKKNRGKKDYSIINP
jgi:hypothetical protein